MAVIHLGEPVRKEDLAPRFAFFALGFRPFYLLAALLALLAVPLWVEMFAGAVRWQPATPALFWHGHEMIFGFAVAVITGFLFTAVRNWTGLRTPDGWVLAGFAALWLAGRVAMFFVGGVAAALIDLLFLPCVIIAIGRLLFRAGSKRNYFLLLVLGALWSADLAFHLALLGAADFSPTLPLHAAVALIVVLETVIAGRVLPMFTANATGVQPWRNTRVDQAAIAATVLALACWVMWPGSVIGALTAACAAVLQGLRCHGWRPWQTLRRPILWILHASHAWIPFALVLLALAPWWNAAGTAVLHVLTVGSMAGLIVGMITRTALGHTGRTLVAARAEQCMYVLMLGAVIVRVLPLLWPAVPYLASLRLAALAWALAFALYLWRYAPMLWFSRVDGKPG